MRIIIRKYSNGHAVALREEEHESRRGRRMLRHYTAGRLRSGETFEDFLKQLQGKYPETDMVIEDR